MKIRGSITANNPHTVGLLGSKVVVITHTENKEEIHIISKREAEKHETEYFFRGVLLQNPT